MDVEKVRNNLALECKKIGSAAAWAKKHKIGATYVWEVLNSKKEPGPKILQPLGIIRVIDYRRIR